MHKTILISMPDANLIDYYTTISLQIVHIEVNDHLMNNE